MAAWDGSSLLLGAAFLALMWFMHGRGGCHGGHGGRGARGSHHGHGEDGHRGHALEGPGPAKAAQPDPSPGSGCCCHGREGHTAPPAPTNER